MVVLSAYHSVDMIRRKYDYRQRLYFIKYLTGAPTTNLRPKFSPSSIKSSSNIMAAAK